MLLNKCPSFLFAYLLQIPADGYHATAYLSFRQAKHIYFLQVELQRLQINRGKKKNNYFLENIQCTFQLSTVTKRNTCYYFDTAMQVNFSEFIKKECQMSSRALNFIYFSHSTQFPSSFTQNESKHNDNNRDLSMKHFVNL